MTIMDRPGGGTTPATAPAEGQPASSPPAGPPATPAPPGAPSGMTFESLAVVGVIFGVFAMVVAVFAVGLAARAADQANEAARDGAAVASAGDPGAGVTTSEVSLVDFAIEPADLVVGADSVLQVSNDGAVEHNLAVDGVASDMFDPGGSGELDLSGLEPGTYTMICEVAGHEAAGMTGTIVIE